LFYYSKSEAWRRLYFYKTAARHDTVFIMSAASTDSKQQTSAFTFLFISAKHGDGLFYYVSSEQAASSQQ